MAHHEDIGAALKKLNVTVKAKRRSLHPSFEIELENYASHKYVRDLSAEELEAVITQVGEAAIEKSPDAKTIGGAAVRAALRELCTNPFSDCSDAAEWALRKVDLHESADRLAERRKTELKGHIAVRTIKP